MARAMRSPWSPARCRQTAIITAPAVWPVRRAVASMPPAAPARSRGALESITRLLGDWKKPKPRPHKAIRQMICRLGASTGKSTSDSRPTAKIISPIPPRIAADTRSASQPARGAATPTARGQGVSSSPVCTWSRCITISNWKGRATKAAICAVNEITEVTIDRANTRMRRRSMGTSGRGSGRSRSTSTTPARSPRASSTRPASLARVRVRTSTPVTTRPKVRALRPAPSRSKRFFTSAFLGSEQAATTKVAIPMGTFTANSHCQDATDNMAEAMVGPAAAEVATTRAFSPTPRPSIR